MAAEGIAKRSTINIGFHDTNFLDDMEKFKQSLDSIRRSSAGVRDAFNNVNQSFDRFNEHMNGFADRNSMTMNRLRDANDHVAESGRRVSREFRDSADTYQETSNKYMRDMERMNRKSNEREENEHKNDDKIIESLSRQSTEARRNMDQMAQHMNHVGTTSSHVSSRVASANGRVARSFTHANSGIDHHIQSIRNAQGRDYRWLRTAQAMSFTSLGLGTALYKGAKDVGHLQQAYIHAGNMAHYGGQRISQVQRDINQQWNVGSKLSIKYGISQDQIASGYQKLVARGYTTNEALHTQKSLLQASIASGDNYNDVVKDSTNVLDAYNLRTQNAAKMTANTKRVTNEMAYAADQTATNFQGLGIGMSYVAATAHTTHQSISETSSALGILSNKGMQASQAGVGLRKVYNSFLSINKKGQQAQAMKQIGLSENDFKTASGHLKSLGSLMSIMNKATSHMDSQQRGAIFHRFFGATGQEAALNLASSTKKLAQLNEQVERSQNMGHGKGYVSLLSAHNMKSAQNQFNVFKQSWQAFMITSARTVLPTFTHALKHVDVLLAKMNDLSPRVKKWTIFGALAVAAIAPISYAIFGIQSAFHGVEITLLHVRKLFSKPMPNGMTNSANKQAGQQELDALKDASSNNGSNSSIDNLIGRNEKTGRSAYIDKLGQKELDHPHLTNVRLRRQRLGTRIWAANKSGLRRVAEIGGTGTALRKPAMISRLNPFNHSAHLFKASKMVRKPSMMARLNPLNKSARLFTHAHTSWIPGVHKLPMSTGLSATNAIRGSGMGMLGRVGGSLLGKADIITSIATSLPLVEKGLKMIDKTRIGGKIFGPLNRSLIKGMNGPVKFINKSWRYIKRGFFSGIRPIQKELNKIFGGTSKASRSNLRGIRTFVHISTYLIGGLWRTIAKALGNVLKYGGKVIADIIKAVRGAFTICGGAVELFIHPWKKGIPLILHGVNLLTSGIGGGLVDAIKGLGSIAGNVLNGIWSSIKKILDGLGDITHFHPIRGLTGGHWFGNSHAAGGAIDHDEMSLVNERGQESAYNPRNNSFRLLGGNGPQVLKLYAGEHVLNAQDTNELLHNGLGKGVTLPGYVNGTDKISNMHGVIPGYADGTNFLTSNKGMGFNSQNYGFNKNIGHDYNSLSNIADWDPTGFASWIAAPRDVAQGFKSGHPLEGTLSGLSDLPGTKLLKLGRLGKFGKYGSKAATFLGKSSGIGAKVSRMMHPISGTIGDTVKHAWKPIHGFGKKLGNLIDPDELNRNFKKVQPILHKGISTVGQTLAKGAGKLGHSIVKNSSGIWNSTKRDFSKFGHWSIRTGRGLMRKGGRLLRTGGSKLKSFGRTTWRGAKRLGRNLWTSTKHVSSRMWRSAKRTGTRIGKDTKSLWNRIRSTTARTWRSVRSKTGSAIKFIRSKASSTWNHVKSGASSAVSHGRSMIDSFASWAHDKAEEIRSWFSHLGHHANGGMITHNQLSLVGERGPETAYNARTGEVRLLGTNGPQITALLAGEKVLTNSQTNQLLHGGLGRGVILPAYAKGTHTKVSRVSGRSSRLGIVGSFNGRQGLLGMKRYGRRSGLIWRNMSRNINQVNRNLSVNTGERFTGMGKHVSKLSGNMKDGLIQDAEDTAKGFGNKFKKLVTYAEDDMRSVIKKLNRGVSGIDVALRAFGGNSHVIHPIHYATGTLNGRIAYDQLGILNDAITGPRQEAILRGNQMLLPKGNNVPVPLQKGDAVLNGDQTKNLINNTTVNHYAKGSGFHIKNSAIKAISKTLKLALKGPAKFFKRSFSSVIGEIRGHQLTKGIQSLGMRAVKPLGVNWTRAMFKFIESLLSPSGAGGSANEFLNFAEKHAPYTYDYGGAPGFNDTDCSGFVEACLRHFGISAPRTSGAQIAHFQHISRSEARPGDLLGTDAHVGIVADNGAHHYFSNHGPHSVHPAASMTPYVPGDFPGGAASFARVPELSRFNKPKHKTLPRLQSLVRSELGNTAIHWLKKASSLISGGGDLSSEANPPGDSIQRWIPYMKKAAQQMGVNLTPSGITAISHRIAKESGGNPTVHQAGGPAIGLVQYEPPTWSSWYLKGHSNIRNGYDQLLAMFNDTNWLSDISAPGGWGPTGHRRKANGGWASEPSIFGEVPGEPEVAINPSRPTADHLILEAISARIKHNPNSKIAKLIKSINVRHRAKSMISTVNGLLANQDNNNNVKPQRRSVNINVNFGDININGNGNNSNVIANKVKRAIRRGVQRASYEAIHKLGLN